MEKVFKRKKELAWRNIDGEMVVMDLDGAIIRGFNETATFIWEHINGLRSINEISKTLAEEFKLSQEQALADVIEFIELLLEKELVEEINCKLKAQSSKSCYSERSEESTNKQVTRLSCESL